MTGPFAGDSIPSIPFVSETERDAAEASGQFAPGVTWVRLDNGEVVEAGYVDLAGAFVSTSGGGVQEVATYADLLAISSPSEGEEARVTNASQAGLYKYAVTRGGDAVGRWFPTEVFDRGVAWARKDTGEIAQILSVAGGGSHVAADFQLSNSPTDGWVSVFPDVDVTDVANDIQFVGSAGTKTVTMTPLTGAPIAYGTDFFMHIRCNVTSILGGGTVGLNTRFRVDAGQGKFGYCSYAWEDSPAPLNNVGWVQAAATSIGEGAVHASAFEVVHMYFRHRDETTIIAGSGLQSLSQIWAPGLATPPTQALGAATLANADITDLGNVTAASDILIASRSGIGNTFIVREFSVFQIG